MLRNGMKLNKTILPAGWGIVVVVEKLGKFKTTNEIKPMKERLRSIKDNPGKPSVYPKS